MDWNKIQKEIDKNLVDLQDGTYDVYTFTHNVSNKIIAKEYPEVLTLEDNNPFVDIIFAMLEINQIELY